MEKLLLKQVKYVMNVNTSRYDYHTRQLFLRQVCSLRLNFKYHPVKRFTLAQKSVLLSRPFFRSRDQDRDLDKMSSSALESGDHGLEITTLAASILDIGDRALA